MRLEGKVALITGGGMGIGEAIALGMAKEGADIAIADIDPKPAQGVAGAIKSMGRRALVVKTDVSSSQEVNQMVKQVMDKFGRIDILVNNAGISMSVTPALDFPEANWDRTISVNLKGVFLCSQAVARQMVKQKTGKIVNISSVAGHRGIRGQAPYCASKAGVLALTKVFAIELAQYGIHVNAICPGTTRTPLVEKLPLDLSIREKRTPTKRLNRLEDVANLAVFLASPESDNITGQDVVVDGGVYALYWPEGE